MKKLILLFLLCTNILLGQKEYIEYTQGYIPILITAPHGGSITTKDIDDRDCNDPDVQCSADLNTDDFAKELYIEFMNYYYFPHLIINNLHRKELDVNRDPEYVVKTSDISAVRYHQWYHGEISKFIDQYINGSDYILILDIHGQAHKHGFVELGYNIPHNTLAYNGNNTLAWTTTSSVMNIKKYSIEDLVRGEHSLGRLLSTDDYKVSPSPKYPIPPLPYFNGGYTTEKYKDFKNVIVIQIELPYEIRKNKTNRLKFIKLLRKAVIEFYNDINK